MRSAMIAIILVALVMVLSSAAQCVRILTDSGVDIPGDAAYSCVVTGATGVPNIESRNCHQGGAK